MAEARLNDYVNETGEGYETRLTLSNSGTDLFLDWFGDDFEVGESVYARHAVDRGTVVLQSAPPEAPLEVLTVREGDTGRPVVTVSAVLRRTLDVTIGDDIRVYQHDSAICELVDPDNDPRVTDQ